MSLKFNWTLLERRVVSDEGNLLSCVIYCQYMKVSVRLLPQRCQTRKTSFGTRSMFTYIVIHIRAQGIIIGWIISFNAKIISSLKPRRNTVRVSASYLPFKFKYDYNIQFLAFILIECMTRWVKFTDALLFCRINLFYSSNCLTPILFFHTLHIFHKIL